MRPLVLFLFFVCSTVSINAQSEFAPLGAEWKYTFHRFVIDFPYNCEYNICDQSFGKLEVVDTVTIDGLPVSVMDQGFGPEMYIHSRNDSVFFYAQNAFHLLYDFTASDGDTIDISVPTFYQSPGSLAGEYFSFQDSVVSLSVAVTEYNPIMVNNEMRKVFRYSTITSEGIEVTIPYIIEGIGSGSAFFGHEGGFVSDGCFGFFICYQDENQSYTPFGCCDYPEPFPDRNFAPLGAEWIYEGYSDGPIGVNGCETLCEGNYLLFRVTENKNFAGRNTAKVSRYRWNKSSEDWEDTGDYIYLYDLDGKFYSHRGFYQFTQTYRTDVNIGDTISVSAHNSYPKWIGDEEYVFGFPTIGGDQVVDDIEIINLNGQERKKITFRSLEGFRIGTVIEGIGPLYDGLLGYDQPIPLGGCAPRLICYRDDQVSYYANEECGCSLPIGSNSTTNQEIENVVVSPIPTEALLHIDNGSSIDFKTYRIKSISGSTHLEFDYSSTIDISALTSGVYLLELLGPKGRIVKKIIKH